MRAICLHVVVSVLVALTGIALYHRQIVRPLQLIGVVNVAQVFQAKEAELVRAIADSRTEQQRLQAITNAHHFALQFTTALAELPGECECMVIDKAAVIGGRQELLDLTPVLKRKVKL